MKKYILLLLATVLPVFSVMLVLLGCETGTGDSTTRQVDLNVWGHYADPEGGYIVEPYIRSAPAYLDLRQYGDELEAYDDHSLVYRGSIGSVNSDAQTCSFTLTGKSINGADVTISGIIEISGTAAIMEGTWIEPTYYGSLYAEATAPNQNPTATVEPTTTATATATATATTTP